MEGNSVTDRIRALPAVHRLRLLTLRRCEKVTSGKDGSIYLADVEIQSPRREVARYSVRVTFDSVLRWTRFTAALTRALGVSIACPAPSRGIWFDEVTDAIIAGRSAESGVAR